MNKYLEILTGLILLLIPVCAWITNYAGLGTAALTVLKGGIVWLLIGIGLILLIIGISDLKE